jgi:hypothetical protein
LLALPGAAEASAADLPAGLGLALLPFVIPQPHLTYPLFTLAGSLWRLVVVWMFRLQDSERV